MKIISALITFLCLTLTAHAAQEQAEASAPTEDPAAHPALQKKYIVAFVDPFIREFPFLKSSEGKFEWEGHPELEQRADELTRAAGLMSRTKLRYWPTELYKGPAKDFNLPKSADRTIQTYYWNVRDLPPGAKQVLMLRMRDAVLKGDYREITVFAYDDMTFDEMRRVALEEGMARVYRWRDPSDAISKNGIYFVGNVPMERPVSMATVQDVKPIEIRDNPLELGSNIAALAGLLGGNVVGMAGALIGGAVVGISSVLMESRGATTTVYQVTYKRDDADEPESTLEAPWAAELKAGDRINVKRGAFSTTLERAS